MDQFIGEDHLYWILKRFVSNNKKTDPKLRSQANIVGPGLSSLQENRDEFTSKIFRVL